MDSLKIGDGEMRVDLGRVEGRVAEELLDGPDVGLVFEHGGGAGVAEGVRVHVLLDFGLPGVLLDELPERVLGQRLAPQGQEEVLLQRVFDEVRAHGLDVVFEIPAGDPAELFFPDSGGVEELQDGTVPVADDALGIRLTEDLPRLR